MRLMSLACSRWKETDLELVAGNKRTGIETSPKVRLAVDIERAGMTCNLPRAVGANPSAIAFPGGRGGQLSPDLPSYISRRAKSSRANSFFHSTLSMKCRTSHQKTPKNVENNRVLGLSRGVPV